MYYISLMYTYSDQPSKIIIMSLRFYIFSYSGNPNKVDARGCTPLHIAATYGNSEALELLIEHKANMWSLDDRGYHPTRVAAINKRLDCCRILDTIGLQLNARHPDFVRAQQMKALKDLQKRMKKLEKINLKGRSNSVSAKMKPKSKKTKGKSSSGEGETTFVLKEKNEEEDESEGDSEEDDELTDLATMSGRNTLRPLPKMTSGAMLNTFNDLARHPLTFEYPDELQGSNSDPALPQRREGGEMRVISRQRGGSGRAIMQVIPLDTTELELENDSPLATLLHSLDLYDEGQALLKERLDLESLSLCSEDDLLKVGLSYGPVKKITDAVQKRNRLIKTPIREKEMTDTEL